jgi:predicted membrane protein DUF2207
VNNSLLPTDYYHLLFPAILFVYYFFFWLLVGRDPKIEAVAPQYNPPHGVSPGVARYIQTGGSDGTTLAAVAAALAAKGVVAIQPDSGKYFLTLLDTRTAVSPEEAALIKSLFDVYIPAEAYAASRTATMGQSTAAAPPVPLQPAQPIAAGVAYSNVSGSSSNTAAAAQPQPAKQAVIDPAEGPTIKFHLDAIQDTFRKNLSGIYFRHNFIFAGLGMLATFAWGLGTALFLDANSSLFITFWLLMFTSIAGLVIGGVWTSKPTHPTISQRISRIMLPVLFFALPGSVIYWAALPKSHGFVLALLISVVLNNVFFVIMRAPTALGRTTLRQLAGFREFLLRVEQDRLERMNTPAEKAELMNRFLPYAIALGVREGWGDTIAAALSDAIVER